MCKHCEHPAIVYTWSTYEQAKSVILHSFQNLSWWDEHVSAFHNAKALLGIEITSWVMTRGSISYVSWRTSSFSDRDRHRISEGSTLSSRLQSSTESWELWHDCARGVLVAPRWRLCQVHLQHPNCSNSGACASTTCLVETKTMASLCRCRALHKHDLANAVNV
jgi:hypothetical protein